MQDPIAVMARRLAGDDTVCSEEIAEALDYVEEQIRSARDGQGPLPMAAFRARSLLSAALRLRQEAGNSL